MKEKVVIFDLDDTLIPNVIYYKKTKENLYVLFREIFGEKIIKDVFLKNLGEIDLRKVKEHGLNRSRFPLSAIELYISYCYKYTKEINPLEIDKVFTTTNAVFDCVDEIGEDYVNIIEKLQEEYKVFILTCGDDIVQTYKIVKSDIFKTIDFDNVLIVPEKNDDTYKKYFEKYGYENCVMIGNSIKSDINPAIRVGMSAIYIPKFTWEFDNATLEESKNLHQINTFNEVPEKLNIIFN